jgi:hypothetical protein
MRYCESSCFKNWVVAQFLVPQATRNFFAQLWDARLAMYDGDAHDLSAAGARVTHVTDAVLPLADGAKDPLRRIAYNGTGKILVGISVPSFEEYVEVQHDTEALRRMLLLKLAAMQEHVPPQKMAEFLLQHKEALGNPYSGEAFAWDESAREIQFAPRSKKWNKATFAVKYAPAAPSPPRGKK